MRPAISARILQGYIAERGFGVGGICRQCRQPAASDESVGLQGRDRDHPMAATRWLESRDDLQHFIRNRGAHAPMAPTKAPRALRALVAFGAREPRGFGIPAICFSHMFQGCSRPLRLNAIRLNLEDCPNTFFFTFSWEGLSGIRLGSPGVPPH